MIEDFLLRLFMEPNEFENFYLELFDLATYCKVRGVPQNEFFRAIVSLRKSGRVGVRIHDGKTYYFKIPS